MDYRIYDRCASEAERPENVDFFSEEEEYDEYLDEEFYDGEEETLSLCETFHYLLCQEDPDPEFEEINRKVLAGARPSYESVNKL